MPYPLGRLPKARTGTSACSNAGRPKKGGISGRLLDEPSVIVADIGGWTVDLMQLDALEAMKYVGLAYGLYSHAEESRDQRVMLDEGGDHPALIVQEDVSLHGSPLWETVRTLTDDPRQIQRYLAFQDTLKMMREMDREQERPPVSQTPAQQSNPKKARKDCHER